MTYRNMNHTIDQGLGVENPEERRSWEMQLGFMTGKRATDANEVQREKKEAGILVSGESI